MPTNFLTSLFTMIRTYGGYTGNLYYSINFELIDLFVQGNHVHVRFINWDESDEEVELNFTIPSF